MTQICNRQEMPLSVLFVIRGIPIKSYGLHPIQLPVRQAAQLQWNREANLLSFILHKTASIRKPYTYTSPLKLTAVRAVQGGNIVVVLGSNWPPSSAQGWSPEVRLASRDEFLIKQTWDYFVNICLPLWPPEGGRWQQRGKHYIVNMNTMGMGGLAELRLCRAKVMWATFLGDQRRAVGCALR